MRSRGEQQMFPTGRCFQFGQVSPLDQSLDNILQHCAKGSNGSFDTSAALVSAGSGRANSNSFQPHFRPKTPKNFFILCPWLSMAIIHLHLSHWRQRSKTLDAVRRRKTVCCDIRWVIPYQRLSKHRHCGRELTDG